MVLALNDVRLIRANAWPNTSRQRKKGENIWGIGPVNPFLDYEPRPEAWFPGYDNVQLLKQILSNCSEVWSEYDHVMFSTVGKTSPNALRELEWKLTRNYCRVPHWCTGWQRKPVYYHARKVEYKFLFPPEMLHLTLEEQKYLWPWLKLMQQKHFPMLEEIKVEPIAHHWFREGKPVERFGLDFNCRHHGMEHFVPTQRSLELLADLLSIQLQRPIRG